MTCTFQVSGLHCANCANKLQKALQTVPGVLSTKIDLEKKTAVVETTGPVSFAELVRVAEGGGFSLVPREERGNA
jgi:copper chaperone CopZ